MKALILAHGEGEYDSYSEFVDLVFLVPNKVTYQSLRNEYIQWAETNRIYKTKPGSKKFHQMPALDFYQWIEQKKAFKKLNFEYSCN